jgi:hypothetical protein
MFSKKFNKNIKSEKGSIVYLSKSSQSQQRASTCDRSPFRFRYSQQQRGSGSMVPILFTVRLLFLNLIHEFIEISYFNAIACR